MDKHEEELLAKIHESQIRTEERVANMEKRLSDLEATRAKIGWWVIGGVAAAVGGLFSIIPKH